jgi:5'-3' exonuclease
MGIKKFIDYIIFSYPSSVVDIEDVKNVDNMYIDLNFVLHYSMYGCANESMLLSRLYNNIDYLMDTIRPTKALILATDGSPSLAKILLQRKRRLDMARRYINNDDSDVENVDNDFRLSFTVGTNFMDTLKQTLKKYLENVKKKYKVDVITIFNEPNEAEMKIIKQIIKSSNLNESHAIISNDCDVIVIAASSNIKKIYIINICPKKTIRCFSVDKLMDLHNKKTNCNNTDFAFVMLLVGNDYIPKLNFISFESLWSSYSKTIINNNKRLITNELTINPDSFTIFLRNLITYIPFNQNNKITLEQYDPKIIKHYLEGLVWCLTNYTTGTCDKYDYMYNYRSLQPLEILYFYEFNKQKEESKIYYPQPLFEPINKHIYSILILPKKAKFLINEKYHNIMDNELSYLYEEEMCKDCENLHLQLRTLNSELKELRLNTDTNDPELLNDLELPIKKKISKISTKMSKHKKNHKNLSVDDIYNAINIIKNKQIESINQPNQPNQTNQTKNKSLFILYN